MPRPPSIQWYYKQYLGDNKVLAMDWDASGMHAWLLNISIQETPPGSIPNDMTVIRRWLRNPSDDVWRRVQPQIFTAWKLRGDRWFNSGIEEAVQRKENYRLSRDGTKQVRERYEKTPRTVEDEEELKAFEVDVGSKNKEPPHFEKAEVLELLDAQQAATFICLELGISGIQARLKILDSAKSYMHRNKCGAKEAAESLVGLWRRYEATEIQFKKGKGKFFEDGEWQNPSDWGKPNGREPSKAESRFDRNLEARRAARTQPTGHDAAPGGEDDGLRTDDGGVHALGKKVQGATGSGD